MYGGAGSQQHMRKCLFPPAGHASAVSEGNRGGDALVPVSPPPPPAAVTASDTSTSGDGNGGILHSLCSVFCRPKVAEKRIDARCEWNGSRPDRLSRRLD